MQKIITCIYLDLYEFLNSLMKKMCKPIAFKFEIKSWEVEIISNKLEMLFQQLELSIQNIVKMVEGDTNFKGIYNPQKDKIIESPDKEEFIRFQSLLRNFNTYVYYNSLILVSYSLFEYFLKSICEFVNEHIRPKFEFNFDKGDTLHNCRDFLSNKTHLIDFKHDDIKLLYDELKKVNHLRNLIAHRNGNLLCDRSKNVEKQNYFELFKRNKHLSINSDGQVYIADENYIKVFVDQGKTFLRLILDKLEENRDHKNPFDYNTR